jgi:lipoate-protein ligase A
MSSEAVVETGPQQRWRLILSGACSPTWNMAVDEAMFRVAAREETLPTLRFYQWQPPALSIGYFQDAGSDLVRESVARGYALIRRPTGGLAVLHENDLSYSMVGILGHHRFPPDKLEAYRLAHLGLERALSTFGTKAWLYEQDSERDQRGLCSSALTTYDLLGAKGKIAGSAQRKSRKALLQHGSISLQDSMSPHLLMTEVANGFRQVLCIELEEDVLSEEEIALATELASEKYEKSEWNYQGRGLSLRRA